MSSVVEQTDLDPAEVVAEHRSRTYRYLLSMARDPDVAEDLTQETLLRALRGLGQLRDRGALVSWLYRLATNVFLDRARTEGRRRLAPTNGRDGEGVDLIEEMPDPASRVDRRVEQAQMSECVRGFVDELPDDYRAVILLHDAHGLSSREIAETDPRRAGGDDQDPYPPRAGEASPRAGGGLGSSLTIAGSRCVIRGPRHGLMTNAHRARRSHSTVLLVEGVAAGSADRVDHSLLANRS